MILLINGRDFNLLLCSDFNFTVMTKPTYLALTHFQKLKMAELILFLLIMTLSSDLFDEQAMIIILRKCVPLQTIQVLQFPPSLYHYITGDLQKQVILVLNKADLCPPPLVIAWKHYMTSQFPHLQIVCFTSHPGQPYSTGEESVGVNGETSG